MARPKVSKAKTKTPGVRKITRKYPDGTKVERYEVRVTAPDGETHSGGTFERYAEAVSALDDQRKRTREGAFVSPSRGRETFKAVAEAWLDGSHVAELKSTTRVRYAGIVHGRLKPLHGKAIGGITPRTLDKLRGDMVRDGLGPLTIRKVWQVLSMIMDVAVRDGYAPVNPCARVKQHKKGSRASGRQPFVIPEMEDVEELLDALVSLDDPRAGEWALYAELAAYAGLRAGELCGLRVRHVDPLRRSVRVEETATDVNGRIVVDTPKSDASTRAVTELPADLCERLAIFVVGKDRDAYVFGDGTKPYRHKNYYRRVFRPTAQRLGLARLRFHDLRHFYASDLLRDPHLSVKDVSTRMGHADATLVLRTYGHLFADSGQGLGDRVAARREAARAKAAGQRVMPLQREA